MLTREKGVMAGKIEAGIYKSLATPRQGPPRATLTPEGPPVSLPRVAGLSIPSSPARPWIVGSFGDDASLIAAAGAGIPEVCDLVEIRLDLIDKRTRDLKPWRGLAGVPLLFTARRPSEGGAGNLDATARQALLEEALDDASMIDLELASLPEMPGFTAELRARGIPWIASYHDFKGPPDLAVLHAGRHAAAAAGAAAFKAALELGWDASRIGDLAAFLTSPGLPVSLMGMGPLAPASRVLFAQLGSVLNYGYLGGTPTAPGQWSAHQLGEAVRSVRHKS